MKPTYFIAQDRWCEVCETPAALVVVETRGDGARLVGAVCSQEHGEQLIDHIRKYNAAELN